MKKIAALLIAGALIAATLSGCSNNSNSAADQPPLNTVPESTVTTEFADAFMPDVMDVPVDATAEPAADVPDESIVPESTDTPAEAATEAPAAQATAAPYAYTAECRTAASMRVGDGWQIVGVDFAGKTDFSGKLTTLRIDPYDGAEAPLGDGIDIAWIAFLPDRAAAAEYLQ